MFDHDLLARICLSIVTAGYAAVPLAVDLNATHATNPEWVPHARFHVVWQVASYAGLGLLSLGLIWAPGPLVAARLYLSALMGAIIYVALFTALATMRAYGGGTYDTNGYLPFAQPVPLGPRRWDVNVTAFSVLSLIWLAGTLSI